MKSSVKVSSNIHRTAMIVQLIYNDIFSFVWNALLFQKIATDTVDHRHYNFYKNNYVGSRYSQTEVYAALVTQQQRLSIDNCCKLAMSFIHKIYYKTGLSSKPHRPTLPLSIDGTDIPTDGRMNERTLDSFMTLTAYYADCVITSAFL